MNAEAMGASWRGTASGAGLSDAEASAAFDDLCRRYAEPERAYHTLDHVAALLETLAGLGGGPAAVLAAWFHDAVYDTRRADNEEQSAVLASEVLGRGGASPELVFAVTRLILATKTHAAPPGDADCAALLDADLAVLGADAPEYDRYARAIRAEYAWVPDGDYRAGRRRVLGSFLGRDRLYGTGAMFEAREAAARANLAREIETLERGEYL